MVHMLFDNPDDKNSMSFLSDYKTVSFKQVYPIQQCLSTKNMIGFCQKCIKNSMNGDTIICWYDFMGVICWWLCKIQNKKRRIIILNILLKDKDTIKNKIARLLYKPALKAKNVTITVTSKEYGEWLNKRLGLNKKYILLHDIYHSSYAMEIPAQTKKTTVFCGGRNGRDWAFLSEIARNLQDIQFNCIMSEEDYEKHKSSFGKNVYVKYDIPQDEFLRMLSEAALVIMPLDTEAPAGLIAMFQAAANDKMIIASNTMSTREYLGKDRGCLCEKNVKTWAEKIRYYIENTEEAKQCAVKFRTFLETECSEKHYAETLVQLAR